MKAFLAACCLLLPFLGASRAVAQIDDSLDYRKYLQSYEEAKGISDEFQTLIAGKLAILNDLNDSHAALKSEIAGINAENKRKADELAATRGNVSGINERILSIGADIASLEAEILAMGSAQVEKDNAAKGTLKEESAALRARLEKLKVQVQELENALPLLEVKIQELITAIDENRFHLSELAIEVRGISDSITFANEDLEKSRQEAGMHKALANEAFLKYRSVLSRFEEVKALAASAAADSGRPAGAREGQERGIKDGAAAGNREGSAEGAAEGAQAGKQRDYQQGFDRGKRDGRIAGEDSGKLKGEAEGREKGNFDGFENGKLEGFEAGEREAFQSAYQVAFAAANSEENRLLGFEDGKPAGEQRAREEAARTEIPKAAKAALDQALSGKPIFELTVNGLSAEGGLYTFSETDLVDVHEGDAMELSQAAMEKLFTALDPASPSILKAVAFTPDFRYRGDAKSYGHPEINAHYVLKYDAYYRESAERSFRSSFDSSFRTAYDPKYRDTYDASFSRNYPESFSEGRRVGYQEGYQPSYRSAYRQAYDAFYRASYQATHDEAFEEHKALGAVEGAVQGREKGLQEGKLNAYKLGFKAGDETGFEGRIDAERRTAYDQAFALTAASIESSSYPYVQSASLCDGSGAYVEKFKVNAPVYLCFKVANVGGQDVVAEDLMKLSVKSLTGRIGFEPAVLSLARLNSDHGAVFMGVMPSSPVKKASSEEIKVKLTLQRGEIIMQEIQLNTKAEFSPTRKFTCGIQGGCNIREQPSVATAKIGRMANMESLWVLDEKRVGGQYNHWFMVMIDENRSGWVWSGN